MSRSLLVAACATLWPALASAQSGAAYLWANQASVPSYVASSAYTHNPSGQPVQVERTASGVYRARFVGMGAQARGGNTQVTSYGGGAAHCKVEGWVPSGSDLQITVRCFDGSGSPADAQFSLLFVPSAPDLGGADVRYAWAGQARTSSYAAPAAYASNQGQPVQVQRVATGRYTAKFPGVPSPQANGGNVQVTSYGAGPEHCKVERWVPAEGGLTVSVACFRGTSPADAAFTVLFRPNG